jgi:hypothetical protein
MQTIRNLFFFLAVGAVLSACETIIEPDLEDAAPVLVVDAWLTNESKTQQIVLAQTQPYFENQVPAGVTGATVRVRALQSGRVFNFAGDVNGVYWWVPTGSDSLGPVGEQFELTIQVQGQTYKADARIGRVPKLDSISYFFEEETAISVEQWVGEFWARDPVGKGDTYWIRTWKNGVLLNKPSELNVAFDAGFSEGGNLDGVTFITPVRRGMNPIEQNEDDEFLPAYAPGDSAYVEIHSISKPAFNFLNEVIIQTDRPGGFSELFARPIANVSTNVVNANPQGPRAVGFFNVAAVSGKGRRLLP